LLAALAAFAFPAAAAAGGFSSPAAGERLGAGSRVEVRWSRLPSRVEEMELLVSVDGGHAFARVADVEPSDHSYSWVVPSLPAEHAVLAIRGRVNGQETLVAETGSFRIERDDARALHPLSYRGGELWTDAGGSAAPAPSDGVADPGHAEIVPPLAHEAAEGPRGAASTTPLFREEPASAREASSRTAASPSCSRAPLAFPRRN
jgi:hypothetical protein